MQCELCGKGPNDGVTLLRQNPQGEKARWRCRAHTDKNLNESAEEITRIIEDGDESFSDER